MAIAKSQELTLLSQARRALEKVRSIPEAKDIRDKAEAIRRYYQQAGESLQAQNSAAEIKLRAERRIGEMLAAMEKHRGGRPSKTTSPGEAVLLSEIGMAHKQSHRYQTIASIPDDQFEQHVRETIEAERELTSVGTYKLGKQFRAKQTNGAMPTVNHDEACRCVGSLADLAGEAFGTIYADPPWKYSNQETRAATDNHYPTMTVDELCAMPVAKVAAKDAHLHLWTTNAFLPESFRLIEAWGFEYRSCFVWVKPQMGIGNYWRVSHEFLLLGVRGKATNFRDHGCRSWGEYDRTGHSAKPHEVREAIERVSAGPFLELFGREPITGWTVLGNQIDANGVLFRKR